jgi:predicted DNA-binding antitoxin AbrB/MazE fold protein
MSITIDAIYQNGSFKPKMPVPLAEGSLVRLVVAPIDDSRDPLDQVIGIVKSGPDFSLADRHDEIVYGGLLPEEGDQP